MEQRLIVEVTERQRDLLLEGLRFVRSSRKFRIHDSPGSSPPLVQEDLHLLAQLVERLQNAPILSPQTDR